jgi:dTDP-4-amino-4,6-dideoxygalactose transaminase
MIPLFHIPDHNISTTQLGGMIHGPAVDSFESNFSDYTGGMNPVSFNSATNAITALFSLLPRPHVTIPAMIPPVVANALYHGGATVSMSDRTEWVGSSYILYEDADHIVIDSAQHVERDQFKIELDRLISSPRRKKDLTMIFSFYPTKPVGSCDGGMVLTTHKDLAFDLNVLSNNGARKAATSWGVNWICPGYKSYMNSFQAHIANANLNLLDTKRERLAEIRHVYNMELGYANTSDHLYRIEVNDNKKFINEMKDNGIVCGIHYRPLNEIPAYSWVSSPPLPSSKALSKRTVSIPFNEKLTEEDIASVIDNIRKLTIVQ